MIHKNVKFVTSGTFSKKHFAFQPFACNGRCDITRKSMSFKDITIVTVGKNGYRINFWGTTESEAVNRMENPDLNKKGKQL